MKGTDYPRARVVSDVLFRNEALARVVRGRAPNVNERLLSILSKPPQSYQKPPFLKEGGELTLGVIRSLLERHSAIWGRF